MFGVLSLAPLDLVSGLLPAGRDARTSTSAGDVAFGVLGLVLVAPGFASQVRRRTPEGLHQVAVVVVALAVASVWSGEPSGVLGAAAVLLALVIVLALHADRQAAVPRPSRWAPSPVQLGLALVLAVPAWSYAAVLAARGRADLPPEDTFAFVPSLWSAVVASLVATSLLALLAAWHGSGRTVPVGCVAVATLLLGAGWTINPDVPASGGRGWGLVVMVWSVAWLWAARSTSRSRQPASRRPAPGPGRSGRTRG
ncbi:MAG TPA: hypothetical protein VGD39_08495 [Nocardioides sp.]